MPPPPVPVLVCCGPCPATCEHRGVGGGVAWGMGRGTRGGLVGDCLHLLPPLLLRTCGRNLFWCAVGLHPMSAGRRKGINNHIKRGLAAYLERQEVTGLLEAVEPREAPVRYALEVLTAICNSLPPYTDTPAMRATLGDARRVWDALTKKLTDREVPDMPEVPEVCSPLACLSGLTSQGRG